LRSELCCHSNETRAQIANLPNSVQLERAPYHSPSYIWVHAVVWQHGVGQTDTQTAVTTIHFASTMPHMMCNNTSAKHYGGVITGVYQVQEMNADSARDGC